MKNSLTSRFINTKSSPALKSDLYLHNLLIHNLIHNLLKESASGKRSLDIGRGTVKWRTIFKYNLVCPLTTIAAFEMSVMIFYEACPGFPGLACYRVSGVGNESAGIRGFIRSTYAVSQKMKKNEEIIKRGEENG